MSETKAKEKQFTRRMRAELENNLSDYFVTSGESLVYKFLVDTASWLMPDSKAFKVLLALKEGTETIKLYSPNPNPHTLRRRNDDVYVLFEM